jgi:hypothetical protein
MATYTVAYRMIKHGTQKEITVNAANKLEVWGTATLTAIPNAEGENPYSAWVERVAYSTGRVVEFNTFEGKAV